MPVSHIEYWRYFEIEFGGSFQVTLVENAKVLKCTSMIGLSKKSCTLDNELLMTSHLVGSDHSLPCLNIVKSATIYHAR